MNRMSVILASLFAVCMGLLTWSGLEYLGKRQSARDARENLKRCRLVAQQIERLRESPTQAAIRALPSTEMTKLMEEAAKHAQILPNSVQSIAPQSPQRQGKTDYEWYSTEVQLAPLTWGELQRFIETIALREPSLVVSQLRLRTSKSASEGVILPDLPERWSVQLRLTQAVFAPITKGSP